MQDNNLYANMPGASMLIAILVNLKARRRRRAWRRRRRAWERVYRTRIDVFGMPASEVLRIFRFSPEAIVELTTTLQDDITSPTHCSHAVQPLVKVLATLNFLATGSFQHTSGAVAGMS